MALLSVIRRWRFREGMPIREMARRAGLSRNMVRKYLANNVVEPRYPPRQVPNVFTRPRTAADHRALDPAILAPRGASFEWLRTTVPGVAAPRRLIDPVSVGQDGNILFPIALCRRDEALSGDSAESYACGGANDREVYLRRGKAALAGSYPTTIRKRTVPIIATNRPPQGRGTPRAAP